MPQKNVSILTLITIEVMHQHLTKGIDFTLMAANTWQIDEIQASFDSIVVGTYSTLVLFLAYRSFFPTIF